MRPVNSTELRFIPQDKLLYDEIVYDKVNGKLKKLRVRIKQISTSDGSRVFNLDIKGLRHKFHLQLSFSSQDLCFLSFEDVREICEGTTCYPCFDSNYQSTYIYARLTFVLYSCATNGEEAKCIKVPLLQKGNKYAATALRKLQYTINSFIAAQEDLKHWWLTVVSSGSLRQGEYVYLCITKYALIIMQRFQILEHHSLASSDISCQTSPIKEEIQISLSKRMETGSSEGFTLLSRYTFKTADWLSIDNAIKEIQHLQLSAAFPERPSPHFNIVHSEISAPGFVPGTTSDNITFMPSYHENNNTSSSSSTGYLPQFNINKLSNIGGEGGCPPPHYVPNNSSSSNGHIPNMVTGSYGDEEIHIRHSDIIRPKNIPLLPELLPKQHFPERPGMGTDPSSPVVPDKPFQRPASSADCFDNGSFVSDVMYEGRESAAGFGALMETDEEHLPPPPPCTSLPHPHGELFLIRPPPCLPEPSEPTLPPKNRLFRSQSFYQLSEAELLGHDYVNLEHSQLLRRNVHDDSPYLRFYYNFGFVRMASIGKKISRRQRFSKELPAVDFNKLENHEQWYDQGYKFREKDLRFCRLSRMNIEKEDDTGSLIYSIPKQEPVPDDPYWNSSLSLTIQKMLQQHPKDPKMSDEIQRAFDLSHEQLATIQVLLSLVPSEKNWRDLAEYIGLDANDISIIEHYCYTYRELAARVVLYHWLLEFKQGKQDKESSWESLHDFVDEMERNDIKNVMNTERQNENIQKQIELPNMLRGERSNVRGELNSMESRQGIESEAKEVLFFEIDEVTYL